MARVRLVGLTKRYGATVAVDNIKQMDIANGEFVTLLGPSGCGKTTTLRMIAGLVRPSEGQIFFDDVDVTHVPPNARNVGFMFQSHALFPHLNVAKNIGFGLSVKNAPKEKIAARVEEMLKLVDLQGFGERMPSQLSGGQQQRVALARVLATDPKVLLFDEPLSALDRNLRDTLKYNILELQRRTGKTAIYVTHDQSEAFAISDRIFVMNKGKVEQSGTQTEIYLSPRSEFVANFIGDSNILDGEILTLASDAIGQTWAEVRCDDIVLKCPVRRTGLDKGSPVKVFVRPENISVLRDGIAGQHANEFEGAITRVVFEGATLHFFAAVNSARVFRVDVAGVERLELLKQDGSKNIRFGFSESTLIPKNMP
jgi:ABC-type Fe3+/spermidine/putrescine transport system ATPase subunit